MNTITVMRHVFTPKPRNIAKYGDDAPREGYINTFNMNYPQPETQKEWEELDRWLIQEKEEAEEQLSEWLNKS